MPRPGDLAPPATHPLNPAQAPTPQCQGSTEEVCFPSGVHAPLPSRSPCPVLGTQQVVFMMVMEVVARCQGGVISCRPGSFCWAPRLSRLLLISTIQRIQAKGRGLLLALGQPGVSTRLSSWSLAASGENGGSTSAQSTLGCWYVVCLRCLSEFYASLFASDGRGHIAKDSGPPGLCLPWECGLLPRLPHNCPGAHGAVRCLTGGTGVPSPSFLSSVYRARA